MISLEYLYAYTYVLISNKKCNCTIVVRCNMAQPSKRPKNQIYYCYKKIVRERS